DVVRVGQFLGQNGLFLAAGAVVGNQVRASVAQPDIDGLLGGRDAAGILSALLLQASQLVSFFGLWVKLPQPGTVLSGGGGVDCAVRGGVHVPYEPSGVGGGSLRQLSGGGVQLHSR